MRVLIFICLLGLANASSALSARKLAAHQLGFTGETSALDDFGLLKGLTGNSHTQTSSATTLVSPTPSGSIDERKTSTSSESITISTGTSSVKGTLPPVSYAVQSSYSVTSASSSTSSQSSPTPSPSSMQQPSNSTVSSTTSEWKIIGVAVIAFSAVATILLLAVFFDQWWRFIRDLVWRRRNKAAEEELVPDWEKAQWELRLAKDPELARYPSFASLPSSLPSVPVVPNLQRIEHLGTVTEIIHDEGGCTLTIGDAAPILVDCNIGDSIAVNGACLTVVEFDKEARGGWFKVWLANETLDRTDLGEREVGDQVNLERAMGAHVRFGGHFVQAHVDTTATLVDKTPDGDSLRLLFQLPEPTPERPSLLPYLIPKGYVAIDGTSLTLTVVDDARRTFGVMLIKHTQEKITLSKKPVGAKVNIEVDMVGKFVVKSVHAALGGGGGPLRDLVEKVVEDVLVKKGVVPQ
ncbi:hypothetical protein GSI_06062 [Ganoderma sinense ZZ0214-1]|uniref:Riboflavin synthase n=1 Tax=Ganoderma sinense ZZ0214-1 TaxID=1077348 RepID=A0A2G8SC90_9APHY|nr:hypothetical protein GSI_06062 [Ganoderma sinense ZZ0214-1]